VGVDPSHPIADAARALDDLEDLTLARKVSGLACVNDDPVSGVCMHHNPPVDVTVPADSARDAPRAPGVNASASAVMLRRRMRRSYLQPSRTARSSRLRRSTSVSASISTILPSRTVKAMTETGCPSTVMTTPALPLTSAG
jgi:hypothetical protein